MHERARARANVAWGTYQEEDGAWEFAAGGGRPHRSSMGLSGRGSTVSTGPVGHQRLLGVMCLGVWATMMAVISFTYSPSGGVTTVAPHEAVHIAQYLAARTTWEERKQMVCGGDLRSSFETGLSQCKRLCFSDADGCPTGFSYSRRLRRCDLPTAGQDCVAVRAVDDDDAAHFRPGPRMDSPAAWDVISEQICHARYEQHLGVTADECQAECVSRDGCLGGFSYEPAGLDCRVATGDGGCELGIFPSSTFHRVVARWTVEGGRSCRVKRLGDPGGRARKTLQIVRGKSLEQCQQLCKNAVGEAGDCRSGFEYHFDSRECRMPQPGFECDSARAADALALSLPNAAVFRMADVDDCAEDPCGAHGLCQDKGFGKFVCKCADGWLGSACDVDENECSRGTHHCHHLAACSNSPGSFSCRCRDGFIGDGIAIEDSMSLHPGCSDVNECMSEGVSCGAHAQCVNTAGSFLCQCDSGFSGEGARCVDVDECASGTHGCDPHALCKNTLGGHACACTEGWEDVVTHGTQLGASCRDVDECVGLHPCADSATCSNTSGSFTCACRSGFVGDGATCTDVDECEADPAPCDPNAQCTNADGSFTCACADGYAGDGFTCSDVDECTLGDHYGCSSHALCTNVAGSFSCSCEEGFTGSGILCSDIDECAGGNGLGNSCAAETGILVDSSGLDRWAPTCRNLPGSYACTCASGFALSPGAGALGLQWCHDVDECAEDAHNSCARNAKCTNSDGSYACECKQGFLGDGKHCADIDECDPDGTAECDQHAICSNRPGGFDCDCATGYTGDGAVCVDVDECAEGAANCSADALCQNTDGAYVCTCNPGFSGDGVACHDVDECAASADVCSPHAACSNTEGSFFCECLRGWFGGGGAEDCADVDECQLGAEDPSTVACDSNAVCTNSAGSYHCTCREGYTGDGFSCSDIDECHLHIGHCVEHSHCVNEAGAYECACDAGFSGAGGVRGVAGSGCSDVDECAAGVAVCDSHADCHNVDGNYTCNCREGYTGDGVFCYDVDECSAQTHTCHQFATCDDSPGSFACTCLDGYTGNGQSCSDVDDCASAPCRKGTCADAGVDHFICTCDDGWSGTTCTKDINECTSTQVETICPGNASCVNTVGSWVCTCNLGWRADHQFRSALACTDVDECADGTHGCGVQATCVNAPGSYTCTCATGYMDLTGDGHVCVDVNECETKHHTCADEANCSNFPGSFSCACNSGYTGDGFTCADEDECLTQGANACAQHAACSNTPGSFQCMCEAGFAGDGHHSCVDATDNCNTTPPPCLHGGSCKDNTQDSAADDFVCQCIAGWSGRRCQDDVDECSMAGNQALCETNAHCVNMPGSFRCMCDDGFTGMEGTGCKDTDDCTSQPCAHGSCKDAGLNSYTCACSGGWAGDMCDEDEDECARGHRQCDQHASCVNSPGSFSCVCNTGYLGDGLHCALDDECASGTHQCLPEAMCTNLVQGAYKCTCPTGYSGDGKAVCADIDECKSVNSRCNANAACTNSEGSFTCECRPGYTGDGTMCTERYWFAMRNYQCVARYRSHDGVTLGSCKQLCLKGGSECPGGLSFSTYGGSHTGECRLPYAGSPCERGPAAFGRRTDLYQIQW